MLWLKKKEATWMEKPFLSQPTIPPGPHYKLLFSITTCVLLPMQLIDVELQQHRYK